MVRTALTLAIALLAQEAFAQTAASAFSSAQMSRVTRRTSPSAFTSRQLTGEVINRSLPQGQIGLNQGLLRGATANSAAVSRTARPKTYQQVQQGPNTTPYLGMLPTNPLSSSTTNYFKNVQPIINQQQRATEKAKVQQQAQQAYTQQKLTEIASQGPYKTTGSEDRAPTGHQAVYMNNGGVFGNNGGYYPQVEIRSVRPQPRPR